MKITWDTIKASFKGDEAKANQFLADAKKLKEGLQPEKFMDYKLADGVSIKVEPELAQGAVVALEDGTMAPDGEHILEGGIKIRVKDGIIEEVMEEKVEDTAMPEEIAAMKKEFSDLKKSHIALQGELKTLKESFTSKQAFEKFQSTMQTIVGLIDFEKPKQEGKNTTQLPGNEAPKKWQEIRDLAKEN